MPRPSAYRPRATLEFQARRRPARQLSTAIDANPRPPDVLLDPPAVGQHKGVPDVWHHAQALDLGGRHRGVGGPVSTSASTAS